MANFTKLQPIDMGELPNEAKILTLASAVYTGVASNGATSPTYGVHFKLSERHDKYLILLKNKGASGDVTASVKAGNSGLWGTKDLDVTIKNGEIAFLKIEAGRFKNNTPNAEMKALAGYTADSTEDMKGDVVITCSTADLEVAVIKQPF